MIGNTYQATVLAENINVYGERIKYENALIDKYQNEYIRIEEANIDTDKKIKKLTSELTECNPLQVSKRRQLQSQLKELRHQNDDRKEYLQSLAHSYGFKSITDYKEVARNAQKKEKTYAKMELTLDNIREDTKQLSQAFKDSMNECPRDKIEDLNAERLIVRNDMESITKEKLKILYKDDYNERIYANSVKRVDTSMMDPKSKSRMEKRLNQRKR